MNTVREVCKYIGSIIQENPICIETGSTYSIAKSNLIHTTTNNLVEFVCLLKCGRLYSLDIDEEHTKLAYSILSEGCRSRVGFLIGDSVDSMKLLGEKYTGRDVETCVDLLCLDSKEFDEEHMVNEYNAIKHALAPRHFVLVDDIHNPNSVKYKKMVPILKELDYEYMEISTPTGLFIASKGYSLPQVGLVV